MSGKTGRPEQLVLGFIVMRRNLADIVPAARLAREMGFTRIQYKNLWVFNEPLKAESIHHDPGALAAARAEILKARETGIPIECEMWPEYNSPASGSGRSRIPVARRHPAGPAPRSWRGPAGCWSGIPAGSARVSGDS